MSKPLKVFITYSHQDTDAKDKLIECLAVMKQQDMITAWHDNEIPPGDEWYKDISDNLADSDILLYLVSASSLASENCNKELGDALDYKNKIRVIPIVLESCDWQDHRLSNIQALPDKGKPINEWKLESKAWQNVVDGIRKVVNKEQGQMSSNVQKETLFEWVFQQGNFLMKIGQIDRAVEAYSHVIKLNMYYADAYNNRGVAYDKKDKIDFAIEDYTKAIELKPDEAVAYSNRGAAYIDKEEIDRAIEDCNKAIELKPDYAEVYYNRGLAYGIKGDFDRTIKDCNKAIELKPKFSLAYNNRGIAYRSKGDLDRAISDYTKAIELDPDYAETCYNRGNAYYSKGDLDRAISDYTKAIELDPDYAGAYNNRGNAYDSKGDLDRAISDYTKTIKLDPDSAVAYNNRGTMYDSKGDLDRAISDYTKAIKLNSELAGAYYNRSICWLHLQNWQEARSDLIIAESKGMNIIATFRSYYKNIEAFERRNGIQLPKDIAAMLTQRRRSRFPKTKTAYSLASRSRGVETQQRQSDPPKTKLSDDDGKPFESSDVANLRERLRSIGIPLAQYVKTQSYFGIRAGRDEAFVIDSATRDELIAEHPSSADILKPFLHGRGIRRWQVEAQGLWLIFAYRGIEINSYPAIQKHLEKYRDSLSKRAGKQNWCELQASLGDSKRFTQTKLVCPNLYNHKTFAVDTDGFYCGHTCYLIPTEETWLCGVLNSRVVEWFYSQVSNQLEGDELRAHSGYMQQIPIPNITSTQKGLIGKIVDYLIYLQKQPTTNSKDLAYARDYVMLKYFERIIDGLVYESYLSEELHQGGKHFFKPLLDEQLPQPEEIQGDKMSAFRDIFEHLYEKTHPIRKNLFFLDSLKSIRIIEGKI